MVYLSGADLGGPTKPGPPIFTCKNYSESYIDHYDNMYSSYIDLKCLLCVYVTVKIQFGNTSTHEYSSYLPSGRLGRYARSHVWVALFRNSGSVPRICLVFLSFLCLV